MEKLDPERRRSSGSAGAQLSTGARKRLIALWMKNNHGMSAARRMRGGFGKRRGSPALPDANVLLGLGNDEVDEERLIEESATVISAAFRGHMGRKRGHAAKEKRLNDGAAKLQSSWRGKQGRREYRKKLAQSESHRVQRRDALEEALLALDARWREQEEADPARSAVYAVRRRTLQKSVDRIEAHIKRVQERQKGPQTSDVTALVAEFAAGLFDEWESQ